MNINLHPVTDIARPAAAAADQRASLPPQIERLQRAWSTHDPALLADCLEAGYDSAHPLHPERNFVGRDMAVANWQTVFEAVPDLRAELLSFAVAGAEVWTEWRWSGEHVAGNAFGAAGVMVFRLTENRIASARVYAEITTPAGPDWEAVLEEVLAQSGEA
jgi:hypothetical protein